MGTHMTLWFWRGVALTLFLAVLNGGLVYMIEGVLGTDAADARWGWVLAISEPLSAGIGYLLSWLVIAGAIGGGVVVLHIVCRKAFPH